MLRNYLTIAYRNLLRHKVFSLINILGLAIGMAACLLIWHYVSYEWSYDTFHEKADRIYRIGTIWYRPDGSIEEKDAGNFGAAGPAMKAELPEVEEFARLRPWFGGTLIRYRNITLPQERIYFADPAVFTLFSFPVIDGDAATGLKEPHSALISETTARKYFGSESPIGKVIELQQGDTRKPFTVNAVFKDVPDNSHLRFDVLLSYKTLGESGEIDWGFSMVHTYILLRPQTRISDVEKKFEAILTKYREPVMTNSAGELEFVAQALTDIHLYSDLRNESEPTGNGRMVNLLACIGGIILIIGYANYINLATARAIDRAREVGIRKVVGASRQLLIRQFLLESLLLNALAVVMALTLTQVGWDFFNDISGHPAKAFFNGQEQVWILLLLFFLLGSVISGLYPAFVLSSYQPVAVLKGKLAHTGRGVQLRKVLIVFQFAVSIFLMATTLLVYRQLSYMRGESLGFNPAQILVFQAPIVTDSMYAHKADVLKSELLIHPEIKGVTVSSQVPGRSISWSFDAIRRKDTPPDKNAASYILGVDYDFIDTYGLAIIAGRNFDRRLGTDRKGLIINEEAARVLGFPDAESAIGQAMVWEYRPDGNGFSIIGVVRNFHQQGLQYAHDPIIFTLDHAQDTYFSCNVHSEHMSETIERIEQAYHRVFPGNPFSYFFLDAYFEQQYTADQQFGQIVTLFSGLAIFVACLGLFGLVSFTTTQRTKEIGVRKVLGASAFDVLLLLNKDFVKLIGLANLIAWPLGWWGMSQWLQNYAFRVEISPWLFLLPALLVFLIALLAISIQTWKAATANPVNILRNE